MKLHANLDKKQHKKQEYVQRKEKVHTKKNVDSEYRILGKKGEGTFSEVLKCQHVKDGTYYACKKMKQHYDGVEQVNNLREIQAMRRLNPHANIIGLHEIIYDKKTGTVALICELMDMNIYEMIRGRRHYLPEGKIKNYMYQLLKSLDHMHRCGIFHRDVKPENILIKDDVLKLADFGSCRSVYSKPPYTEYISTRWYRAPECLLTDGYYSYRMDLWSVGCVFFEVMSLHPLFPGSNEVDQIAKIHDVLGTPDSSVLNKMKHRNRGINFDFPPKKGTGIEKLIPHASSQCIELIYKMCTYDPEERITAKQALRHSYFRDLREADKKQAEAHRQLTEGSSTASVATAANTTATGTETSSWRQNQIQKKRIRILPPSVDSAVELEVDIEPTKFEGESVVIDEMLAYSIPQLPPLFETPPKTVMHNAIVQKQQPVIEKSCKGGENNNSVKVKRKFSSSFPAIYDEKSATSFHMLSNSVSPQQASLPECKPTCRKKRSKHSNHSNEETSSLKIITKETSNYNGESSSLKFKKEKTNYNGESSSLKIKSKENLKTTKRRKSLVTDFKMSPGDKLKGQSKKDQTKPVNQKIVALSGNEDKTIHGTALRVNDIKKRRLKKGIVETKFDNSKGFQGFPTLDWLHNSKPVQYETFERLNENDVDYVENKVATLPQPQNSPMLPELIVSNQDDRKRTAPNILNMTYIVRKPVQTPYEAHFKAMSIIPEKLRTREGHPVKKQQQLLKVDTRIKQESRFPEIQQRRQRRLVEQQQKSNFSVKAGNNTEGLVKAPLPHLLGAGSTYGGAGPKSVYSTTLPKVHLPRHQFAHHQTSSNLLPGILKTNVLQPKTLHKSKLKKEPKSIYGHNHYQLPTINRHVYHH